jgi:hypothetical protein
MPPFSVVLTSVPSAASSVEQRDRFLRLTPDDLVLRPFLLSPFGLVVDSFVQFSFVAPRPRPKW